MGGNEMKVIVTIGKWYKEATPGTKKSFDILSNMVGPATAAWILGYQGVLTHEEMGEKITQLIQSKDYDRLELVLSHLTPEERADTDLEEVLRANNVLVEYRTRCMLLETPQ